MKIRIRGNTLRLRLTQTELDAFAKDGEVKDMTKFNDDHILYYTIEKTHESQLSAILENNAIKVFIPQNRIFEWTKTDLVGIDNGETDADKLHILVEKDFQCLKPRSGEEDQDGFPNPMAIDMVD